MNLLMKIERIIKKKYTKQIRILYLLKNKKNNHMII